METLDIFLLGKIAEHLDQKSMGRFMNTCKKCSYIKNIFDKLEMSKTMNFCQLKMYPNLHNLTLHRYTKILFPI